MVDIQYANAYTEVLEILKNISQEEYNKVPKDRINLFKHNANKEYIFNYDSNKHNGFNDSIKKPFNNSYNKYDSKYLRNKAEQFSPKNVCLHAIDIYNEVIKTK